MSETTPNLGLNIHNEDEFMNIEHLNDHARKIDVYAGVVNAALLALEKGAITQEEYEKLINNIGAAMIKYGNSDFPNVAMALDELFTIVASFSENKATLFDVTVTSSNGYLDVSEFYEDIPEKFILRFTAPSDYLSGDKIRIGEKELRVVTATAPEEFAPDGAFVGGALVSFDVDMASNKAFFKAGAGGGGGFPSVKFTGRAILDLKAKQKIIGLIASGWNKQMDVAPFPTVLPTGNAQGIAWSPNGRYLAVGHDISPFVTIYDWQSGIPVKLANPADLPTGYGFSIAWSPNGRYLAIAHNTSPFMTIYDWQSGIPVKLANPAVLPTGNGHGAAWSSNGRYLAIGHYESPFVTIYDWQSGAPVKLANPALLPTGNGHGAAWSPDGRYLAVGHDVSPFVTIYDWQSGIPVKLANPAVLPTGLVIGTDWSPDGRFLALSHYISPFITTYDWQSEIPVKLANPADLPLGYGHGAAWSPDGRYLAVAFAHLSPFMIVYDWQSGAPVKLPNPAVMPTGHGAGAAWSPDGRYLAIAHTTSPFVTSWFTQLENTVTEFTTLQEAGVSSLRPSVFKGIGFARSAAKSGDIINVDLVF